MYAFQWLMVLWVLVEEFDSDADFASRQRKARKN